MLRRDERLAGVCLEDIEDYTDNLNYRNAVMREEELSSAVNLSARTEDIVENVEKIDAKPKQIYPAIVQSAQDHRHSEFSK